MRKILPVILILFSTSGFGQQWIAYQIDSVLTLDIPENYQLADTAGQRLITAQVDNGLVQVLIVANEGRTAVNIENEKDLLDSYRGFEDGMIASSKGQLLKDEIVEKNGLKFLRFSFRANMGAEKQIRHCLGIFVNKKVYAFTFWELESMTNEMADVREKFFSSIVLRADLTLKDQMNYSIEATRSYNLGYYIGYLLAIVLFLGIPISIIVFIKRKLTTKSVK